jgi:hypothetical protein
VGSKVGEMPRADLLKSGHRRAVCSEILQARFGGGRMEKDAAGSLSLTGSRTPAQAVPRQPPTRPESQSPAVEGAHPLLQRLKRSATRGRSFAFRDRPPPTGGAMKNDFIEGDEWDAYVALDTFNANGTRDGLTRLPHPTP